MGVLEVDAGHCGRRMPVGQCFFDFTVQQAQLIAQQRADVGLADVQVGIEWWFVIAAERRLPEAGGCQGSDSASCSRKWACSR